MESLNLVFKDEDGLNLQIRFKGSLNATKNKKNESMFANICMSK